MVAVEICERGSQRPPYLPHPSYVIRMPHPTPITQGTLGGILLPPQGEPRKVGSAPGGSTVGMVCLGTTHLQDPLHRLWVSGSKLPGPYSVHSAHSSPPGSFFPLPALGEAAGACPGACSGKHQQSSVGSCRVRWQRQGCRGGRAPMGWTAGCWAEAHRHRQKLAVAFCLHFASHTRLCTRKPMQASKHKPMCTPTGHTHTKHTTAIERTIAQIQPPACIFLFVSLLHMHGCARTHIPPQSLHLGISHLDLISTSGPYQPLLFLALSLSLPPLACQSSDHNSPVQKRGSAEERGLGRQEEWGKPSGLTYLYPSQALPMAADGESGRQPSRLGQCGACQGPLH